MEARGHLLCMRLTKFEPQNIWSPQSLPGVSLEHRGVNPEHTDYGPYTKQKQK